MGLVFQSLMRLGRAQFSLVMGRETGAFRPGADRFALRDADEWLATELRSIRVGRSRISSI